MLSEATKMQKSSSEGASDSVLARIRQRHKLMRLPMSKHVNDSAVKMYKEFPKKVMSKES